MSHLFFAYGTLLPGQSRWQFLQPLVVDEGVADRVNGSLYDTGQGYPAAMFAQAGTSAGTVHGRVFRLHTDRVQSALTVLDEVEHTADEHYHRVRIDTDDHRQVWAYEYRGPNTLAIIAGGSWLDHLDEGLLPGQQ